MRRMRRTLALVVTAASFAVPTPSIGRWAPDVGAAREYAAKRAGEISFAVKTPGRVLYAHRGHRVVPAASVLKAMFMTAYLRRPSLRDRDLREKDRDLLAPMIRRSDNAAATRIADQLGPRPINRLARAAHMTHFRYTRPWGLSSTDATEQARFFFHLERYIPDRHDDYARYLLSHIVRSQRWGIADVNRPDWKLFFKSGWGSGSGAVSHQAAFLESGPDRIAVAIMIEDSPSHEYSTETLRGVAARLLRDLP